jgi:hypothetical protein
MDYTLVHNSPCHEPQQNWCWCNKCQSLFYAEVSMGGARRAAHTSRLAAATTAWQDSDDISIAGGERRHRTRGRVAASVAH